MAPHEGHGDVHGQLDDANFKKSLDNLREWTHVLTILVFILVACAFVVFFLQLLKLIQAVVDVVVPKKKRRELAEARRQGKRVSKKSQSSKSGKKKKSKKSKSSKSSKSKGAKIPTQKDGKKSSGDAGGQRPGGGAGSAATLSQQKTVSTEKTPAGAGGSSAAVAAAKPGDGQSASQTPLTATVSQTSHVSVPMGDVLPGDATTKSDKPSANNQSNSASSKKLPSVEQLQKKEKLKALNDKKLLNPV